MPPNRSAYGIFSLWCGALEYSPTYLADGTILYGYTGTWRSTDRGETWTKVLNQSAVTRSIAMSPQFATDGEAILNASTFGTFRSSDHGATWTLDPTLWDERVNDIQYSRGYPADGTAFATPQSGGFWRSTDGRK